MWMMLVAACVEPASETGEPVSIGTGGEPIPGDSAATTEASAGCTVTSDLADVNYLEGDRIHFTVGCSGALASADAVFTAAYLPDSATFDPATRVFSWTTGPADGGRIDVRFSVLPSDGSTPVPDTGVVTFWVADDPSAANNVPVNPATYTEEWGLPVVHVSAPGALTTEAYSAQR